MRRLPLLGLALCGLLPGTARAQGACAAAALAHASPARARALAALGPRHVTAARLRGPAPRIDGRLDDPAWCAAETATDFVQSVPAPGALATLPSTARVLYDDEAVYVAMRMIDPHPDSIAAPYPRRDDEASSDWAFVEIDSRFDHRTGYSFGVNPRGVQADGAWSDDVDYDGGWSGVWEGAATIDSAGWSAEFRIPFSQLALARGAPGAPLTWGINFYRNVANRGESSNWSPRLPSVVGVISHFNELHGLVVPPRRSALEVLPYGALAATREPGPAAPRGAANASAHAGLDLRYRPTASSAGALSIRPDFGQVEADPAVVNLTTFETFLPEQRPMFVEGSEVFRFSEGLAFSARGTSFAEESPFYSRRVGRTPRGPCPAGAVTCETPGVTDILAAVRLSGRTADGWSGGLFQAWTGGADARFTDSAGVRRAVRAEPSARFTVARAVRQGSGGRTALGAMVTYVDHTGMNGSLDSLLARHALVAGGEGRARLAGDGYEVSAFGLASRVDGSPAAIGRLRREPLHGYARTAPADTMPHTTMTGLTAQARLARILGRLQWSVAGRVVSRGFEANDAGFQRNADWLLAAASWQYLRFRPGRFIRQWSIGSQQAGAGWTTAGALRAATVNATGGIELRSFWGGSLALDREFPARDPEVLRGGPALRLPGRNRATLAVHSDTRQRWSLDATAATEWEPATRSSRWDFAPVFSAFVSDRLQVGIEPSLASAREAWQYAGQAVDGSGTVHYLVGALRQTTAALTLRGTYAFSPHLTLQWYSQVHLSGGHYTGFSEVTAPEAAVPEDRVTPIAPARLRHDSLSGRWDVDAGSPAAYGFDDPAFSQRDLRINFLMRWEFAPGSTLFLVWSHVRAGRGAADFALDRGLRRLWREPGTNALAVKVSYWIGL